MIGFGGLVQDRPRRPQARRNEPCIRERGPASHHSCNTSRVHACVLFHPM